MDFSKEGKKEIVMFHTKIVKQMARIDEAFKGLDPEMAEKIVTKEEKYSDLEADFRKRHLKRLQEEREESIETHEVHMELMDLLRQVNVYAGHIAQTIAYIGEKRETKRADAEPA
jgi:phosphate:Na+ symporter